MKLLNQTKASTFKLFLSGALLSLLIGCSDNNDEDFVLTGIQVTSEVQSLGPGFSTQLIATEYYSNGTTTFNSASAFWSSSDESIATVDPSSGFLRAVSAGDVVITASEASFSDTLPFTVTPATLDSIEVSPAYDSTVANGHIIAFTAQGRFSDFSVHDISNDVDWISSNSMFATIDASGVAMGVSPGDTSITASVDPVTSNIVALEVTDAVLESISIVPELTVIAQGTEKQYAAKAKFSDKSETDVTEQVNWRVGNQPFAAIDSSGLLTSLAPGFVEIDAFIGSTVSNTSYLIITEETVSEIVVSPSSSSLASGLSQQYEAVATFTDGTQQNLTSDRSLSWQSSNLDVASINSAGIAKGIMLGSSEIKATFNRERLENISSSAAALVVTDAEVASLVILPTADGMLISPGGSSAFSAEATLTDGSPQDVTRFNQAQWRSADTNVVTINQLGIASGVGSGQTTLNASLDGQTSNSVVMTATYCASLRNEGLEFICPLTESEATDAGYAVVSTNRGDGLFDPVGVEFVEMTWFDANEFCNTLTYNGSSDWRLPSSNEFTAFIEVYDHNLFRDHDWATTNPFWTSSEFVETSGFNGHLSIQVTSGDVGKVSDTSRYYTSCVREGILP